ncbi:hypothetical protein EBU94_02695, partial [bacterium]|nr:hypothetical protein [bacterium]
MVEEIHKSPCYGYVVETGAGSAISNHLLSFPGASKTIEACYTPYSKEHVESVLNKDLSKIRAISMEYSSALSQIPFMGSRANQLLEKHKENFFVLSSSFQISSTPNVSSHGWMSIKGNFYHFTLPALLHDMNVLEYRLKMNSLVGEIGASVIHHNMVEEKSLPYLDVCIENGKHKRLNLLKSIAETENDLAVVFYPNGETDRLETICRSSENIVIFKGSFNPPHKAHIDMVKTIEKEFDTNGYFVISMETFGKGLASPEDLLHRINMINSLGYPVIINKKPLFRDFVSLFNNRLNKGTKLHFVMGEDTALRFVQLDPKDMDYCPTKNENGETFKNECV